MHFKLLFDWWGVFIQWACKSLVIRHLSISHNTLWQKMLLHMSCTHTAEAAVVFSTHRQVNQAPTSKFNTRAPPTASPPFVPLPSLFHQPVKLREKNHREISSPCIVCRTFLSFLLNSTAPFLSTEDFWQTQGKLIQRELIKLQQFGLVSVPDTSSALRAKS